MTHILIGYVSLLLVSILFIKKVAKKYPWQSQVWYGPSSKNAQLLATLGWAGMFEKCRMLLKSLVWNFQQKCSAADHIRMGRHV